MSLFCIFAHGQAIIESDRMEHILYYWGGDHENGLEKPIVEYSDAKSVIRIAASTIIIKIDKSKGDDINIIYHNFHREKTIFASDNGRRFTYIATHDDTGEKAIVELVVDSSQGKVFHQEVQFINVFPRADNINETAVYICHLLFCLHYTTKYTQRLWHGHVGQSAPRYFLLSQ